MKVNDIINEGFWDDIKAGYRAGREDYIRRKAAELGMTPAQVVQQANQQPPGSNAPPANTAAQSTSQPAAPYSGTLKPTSTTVNFNRPKFKVKAPTAPTAKPMSYKGAATGTLGGAGSTPYTATVGTPKTVTKPAAPASSMPPTLSGGAPGVGNPKVDPDTGWPVGAQSWAASPLPTRPGATPAATKSSSVTPAPAATTAAPTAKPTAPAATPNIKSIINLTKGLTRAEAQALVKQLES